MSEYPIINVEAENEHFEISDSVISWIESHKSGTDLGAKVEDEADRNIVENADLLRSILTHPALHQNLSAPGMAWNTVEIFSQKHESAGKLLASIACEENPAEDTDSIKKSPSPQNKQSEAELLSLDLPINSKLGRQDQDPSSNVRMRGDDEWAPPRAQIVFNIHEENNFRKLMQRQNYRCAGCGTKIDLELARRLVLFCHYLGKYFCKCCFSHKAINLPGYILQKWDFHKYPVSHFALQLLDRIANEPLFNINDINPSLYRKVKKLRHLLDIRMQLYYIKIYITTCTQTDKLDNEFKTFTHQHLLLDDVHLYSLNNLIEIQHGKLYEYLNDLVTRSIAHIAQCDRCRAKGHYCQLCGPSSLMSSLMLGNGQPQSETQVLTKDGLTKLKASHSIGQNLSASCSTNQVLPKTIDGSQRQQVGNHSRSSSGNYSNFTFSSPVSSVLGNTSISTNINDYELIFPFEIGRVAQCRACGCCFHLQCFQEADQNCPKCERIQRRKAELTVPGVNVDPQQQLQQQQRSPSHATPSTP